MGATNNVTRRLAAHNGQRSGGAKYTRTGRPWRLLCAVHGFDKIHALRFEWRLKRRGSVKRVFPECTECHPRLKRLYQCMHMARWTRRSEPAHRFLLTLEWFCDRASVPPFFADTEVVQFTSAAA